MPHFLSRGFSHPVSDNIVYSLTDNDSKNKELSAGFWREVLPSSAHRKPRSNGEAAAGSDVAVDDADDDDDGHAGDDGGHVLMSE